jgi:hypothetical protein
MCDEDYFQCYCDPDRTWSSKSSYERHKRTEKHFIGEQHIQDYRSLYKETQETEKKLKAEVKMWKSIATRNLFNFENCKLKQQIKKLNAEKFELLCENENMKKQLEKKTCTKTSATCPF